MDMEKYRNLFVGLVLLFIGLYGLIELNRNGIWVILGCSVFSIVGFGMVMYYRNQVREFVGDVRWQLSG